MNRKTYIGGSDASAILGKNEYQSILKTWRKKVGQELDDIDNHHIRRGIQMERLIENHCIKYVDPTINVDDMFKRFGTKEARGNLTAWKKTMLNQSLWKKHIKREPIPDRPQISIRHPKFDYCGGHPDGLTATTVWEFKAPAPRNLTYIYRSGVSKTWIIQVQYYMWITGLQEGKIAIWDFDQWRPIIIRLRPNRQLIRAFEEYMPAFWWHVKMEIEPNMQGVQDAFNFRDDDIFDSICEDYMASTDAKYIAEDRHKRSKAIILSYLNGEEFLTTDKHYISARKQKRFGTEFARLIVRPVETEEAAELKSRKNAREIADAKATLEDHDIFTLS